MKLAAVPMPVTGCLAGIAVATARAAVKQPKGIAPGLEVVGASLRHAGRALMGIVVWLGQV